MGDAIISMIGFILGTSVDTSDLMKSAASYNSSAYTMATSINETGVKPVAAIIVGIICSLELARVASRVEGDGQLGVRLVAGVMLKLVLMVIAIKNSDMILKAIQGVGEAVTQNVSVYKESNTSNVVSRLVRVVNNMSWYDQFLLVILLFLPWIVACVANIALTVMIFLRFVEIYVLTSCATLPLAFIGHPETKSITVTFLRRYAKAILHGVVLIIVVVLYSKINPSSVDFSGVTSGNILSYCVKNIGNLLVAPIVFAILVVSSNKFTGALVGE